MMDSEANEIYRNVMKQLCDTDQKAAKLLQDVATSLTRTIVTLQLISQEPEITPLHADRNRALRDLIDDLLDRVDACQDIAAEFTMQADAAQAANETLTMEQFGKN